ncbi:MAG: hypothetical protein OEV33_00825 [Armatimonadota bacterium]|nr:hypothetical protein [Armatimonadota bacterium]
MPREFTAISALSMVIASVAGTVLCMQVANMEARLEWELSTPVLWGLEAAVFGTAVYAWCSRVSLGGWMLGIAGLSLVRLALTTGAALVLAATRGDEHLFGPIRDASAVAPRMCAFLFSLMVFYPLRTFLPVRRARAGRRRTFSESAAVKSALGAVVGSDSDLVIWAGSEPRAGGGEKSARAATSMLDRAHRPVRMEGAIELPVRLVLAQMPPELVNERAEKISDSHMMSVPLEAILPQLKEARVAFSPAQIREWLPDSARRALTQGDADAEETESVILPLAQIVPQLPQDALALPAPSPPAWANVGDTESVVFATV